MYIYISCNDEAQPLATEIYWPVEGILYPQLAGTGNAFIMTIRFCVDYAIRQDALILHPFF